MLLNNVSDRERNTAEISNYFLWVQSQMKRYSGTWRSYLRFFLSTWLDAGYVFRVYMTRRCFNLNEMLFTFYTLYINSLAEAEKTGSLFFSDEFFLPLRVKPDEWERICEASDTFITQSALLGYVRQITERYYKEGTFPRILIVDELAIYASQIRLFLQEFESSILYVWKEAGYEADSDKTRKDIHRDFRNAIDVRVYAKSRKFPQSAAWIQAEKTMSISQWRSMILDMSLKLSESDFVENTTYVPFFRMSERRYRELADALTRLGDELGNEPKWSKKEWTYRTLRADVWRKSMIVVANPAMDGEEHKLLGTLRVHWDRDSDDGSRTVRVIPLILFKSIPREGIRKVSSYLADYMETFQDAGHIVSVLRDPCPMLWKLKMQWISFFLSAALFFEALEEARIPFENGNFSTLYAAHDLDKIAKNFGVTDKVLWALCEKMRSDSPEDKEKLRSLRNKVYQELRDRLEWLWIEKQGDKNRETCQEAGKYIATAEEFFYKAGLNHEYDLLAEVMYWNKFDDPANALKRERSSLEDYLNYFLGQDERYSPADCLDTLLMTMDTGVTAMTIRDDTAKSEGKYGFPVVNWVRAGEQALCLEARRYYRFFPALIALEARCLRSGYSVSKNLKAFCKSLAKKSRSPISARTSQQIARFYDQVQEYGYRLRDWDFNFLMDLDVPTFHDTNDGWNDNVRPRHEWDDSQWETEVQEICKNEADSRRNEKYCRYERKQQELYFLEARDFPLS